MTSARWFAALSGLALLFLLARVLGSGDARTERTRAPAAPIPAAAPPLAVATAGVGRTQSSAREDAGRDALRSEVQSATERLAQSLESPDHAETLWRTAVASQAEALGDEALPALRALLADDQRSVEEHVAASELVAALEER